ncbi:type II toxin-antitoxin system HicA family toxin [Patescibacteria group bacterium]|nr:type II toxin-antitoxin system HicA family toxin [Patescibacteria group bacterium]
MPKLPVITSKKLVKILKELGFKLDHTTGSHFIFYQPAVKRRAVVPIHSKDLPKGTLMSILRETGINKEEFEKIIRKK